MRHPVSPPCAWSELEGGMAQAWPVLLVCRDRSRVDQVRRALETRPVPVALNVVASAMPALYHVLEQPVRLVIVDWALEGPSGQALVRQLARLCPALPVLAFDTLGIGGAAEQVLAWPWSDLTAVLDHALPPLPVHERGSPTEAPS